MSRSGFCRKHPVDLGEKIHVPIPRSSPSSSPRAGVLLGAGGAGRVEAAALCPDPCVPTSPGCLCLHLPESSTDSKLRTAPGVWAQEPECHLHGKMCHLLAPGKAGSSSPGPEQAGWASIPSEGQERGLCQVWSNTAKGRGRPHSGQRMFQPLLTHKQLPSCPSFLFLFPLVTHRYQSASFHTCSLGSC